MYIYYKFMLHDWAAGHFIRALHSLGVSSMGQAHPPWALQVRVKAGNEGDSAN